MELNMFILDAIVKDLPTSISVILSLASIGIAAYLHKKKINIDDRASESAIHERQVKTLLVQIEQLSEDLNQARKQLQEIHNQNIELMTQLRAANQRISELEITIQDSRRSGNTEFMEE